MCSGKYKEISLEVVGADGLLQVESRIVNGATSNSLLISLMALTFLLSKIFPARLA